MRDEDANDSGHDASLESDDFESDGKPSDASESKMATWLQLQVQETHLKVYQLLVR